MIKYSSNIPNMNISLNKCYNTTNQNTTSKGDHTGNIIKCQLLNYNFSTDKNSYEYKKGEQ